MTRRTKRKQIQPIVRLRAPDNIISYLQDVGAMAKVPLDTVVNVVLASYIVSMGIGRRPPEQGQ